MKVESDLQISEVKSQAVHEYELGFLLYLIVIPEFHFLTWKYGVNVEFEVVELSIPIWSRRHLAFQCFIQRSAKVMVCGLVKFVPGS